MAPAITMTYNAYSPQQMIVDADGVLLNWWDGFMPYAAARGYELVDGPVMVLDRVYQRLGISEKEASNLIRDFNQSAAAGFLGPWFDSIKGIRKLNQEHGMTFHVLTSFGTCAYATTLRTRLLQNLFGNVFRTITYLDQYETKDKALEQFAGSGMFFVEDSPHQLERCEELGLQPALIAHPYNVGAKYPRYQSWSHFISHNFS